ncbi:MAG: 4-hydroxy-tetrahydrodipicolinate reductase [Alphaproteobacteria bacterium]|nr:4-hydroxy-tetrahydrodipicolinate reductase [Alphaproteobacteria bacterium]
MIRIGLAGAGGRMGKLIAEFVLKDPRFRLAVATVSPLSPLVGKSIIPGLIFSTDQKSLFAHSDIVVDFTNPSTTFDHVRYAIDYKKPLVIGTTGLSSEHKDAINAAAQYIPILYAPNTSLGVTIMQNVVKRLSQILGDDFDAEISEIHHKHKVDAPSGTALALGDVVAEGRQTTLDQVARFNRHGHTGPRAPGEIGFSVQRGGAYPGEHTVRFMGDEESLEITHRSFSRALFARGAIAAAYWLAGKKEPGLYTMHDVLGLT